REPTNGPRLLQIDVHSYLRSFRDHVFILPPAHRDAAQFGLPSGRTGAVLPVRQFQDCTPLNRRRHMTCSCSAYMPGMKLGDGRGASARAMAVSPGAKAGHAGAPRATGFPV
ncbi:hypothetical protein ACTGVO_11390, partial [Streptococcus suis]